jgi:coenzyme PQQ biosynthesis protein PqqD
MELNEKSCPALARGVRLQTDPKTGEPLLLFPEGVLFLSETAQEILTRCDGRTTLAAVAGLLAEEYEADAREIQQDVLDCVRDLYQRKLIAL